MPRERLLRQATRAWIAEAAWPRLSPEQQAVARSQLTLIDTLTPMVRALDRRIREQAERTESARLLMTIPGVGPYRGLLLASELAPISRFPRAEHLVSYAGLAPVTLELGRPHAARWHPAGGEPQGANRRGRGALVSAIPSHLRAAPQSPLSRGYERLKARLGWRVARVATARKLSRVIHAMRQRGEGWKAAPCPAAHGTSSIAHMQPHTCSTRDRDCPRNCPRN